MPPSLEIFVPRRSAGDDLSALFTDALSIGISMVSVSGTPDQAVRVAARAQAAGLTAQIQLQRSDLSFVTAKTVIDSALAAGVTHVLVLGAEPGRPATAADAFGSVLELVKFIKSQYASSMSVAVCGFPRGSAGEASSYEDGLAKARAEVAAGADLVIAQPVFDIDS